VTDTVLSPSDLAGQVATLQKQLAGVLQTQQTGQGGTYPHAAILSGAAAHTVLGPCDENGKVLPGAWNTVTGLWEDPATAEANAKAAAQAQDDQVAAAKTEAQAALVAKARQIAEQELAEEADLGDLVAAQKEELRAAQTASPAAPS
jgi:hypothetical protein